MKSGGSSYTYTLWTGSAIAGEAFSEDLNGLDPNSIYCFNAQAKNSAGESEWGEDETFTTLVQSPDAIIVIAYCPVDLRVTDPCGLVISKQLNEISGATYSESDIDGNGDLDDVVMIPQRKLGDYSITVVPEPNALPKDTYALGVILGSSIIVFDDHVPISDIPQQPYVFESKRCSSDFDGNGTVNVSDLTVLALSWLDTDCCYPDWCQGIDLNYDGLVNLADFAILTEHWLEIATP